MSASHCSMTNFHFRVTIPNGLALTRVCTESANFLKFSNAGEIAEFFNETFDLKS